MSIHRRFMASQFMAALALMDGLPPLTRREPDQQKPLDPTRPTLEVMPLPQLGSGRQVAIQATIRPMPAPVEVSIGAPPLTDGMNREEDAPQLRLPDRIQTLPESPSSRPLPVVIHLPEDGARARRATILGIPPQKTAVMPILITALDPPSEATTTERGPHRHSTIAHAKVCRECGQKLSGAELREIRERQAKAAKRSRWDERQYLKLGGE